MNVTEMRGQVAEALNEFREIDACLADISTAVRGTRTLLEGALAILNASDGSAGHSVCACGSLRGEAHRFPAIALGVVHRLDGPCLMDDRSAVGPVADPYDLLTDEQREKLSSDLSDMAQSRREGQDAALATPLAASDAPEDFIERVLTAADDHYGIAMCEHNIAIRVNADGSMLTVCRECSERIKAEGYDKPTAAVDVADTGIDLDLLHRKVNALALEVPGEVWDDVGPDLHEALNQLGRAIERSAPSATHARNLAAALGNVHGWVKRSGRCTCAHTDGRELCTSAQVLAAYHSQGRDT